MNTKATQYTQLFLTGAMLGIGAVGLLFGHPGIGTVLAGGCITGAAALGLAMKFSIVA